MVYDSLKETPTPEEQDQPSVADAKERFPHHSVAFYSRNLVGDEWFRYNPYPKGKERFVLIKGKLP